MTLKIYLILSLTHWLTQMYTVKLVHIEKTIKKLSQTSIIEKTKKNHIFTSLHSLKKCTKKIRSCSLILAKISRWFLNLNQLFSLTKWFSLYTHYKKNTVILRIQKLECIFTISKHAFTCLTVFCHYLLKKKMTGFAKIYNSFLMPN